MQSTQKQETCEQRVERHLDSRLEDLRLMLNPQAEDCTLGDDGTLDTVICCGDEEFRFSDTSDYRDEDTGEIDLDEFLDDNMDEIREVMFDRFYEYGLCFDYVAPDTFNDQDEGYFRFQISYGGPSEEFRFYSNLDYSPHRIEFWFLNWFDGASRTLHGDDHALLLDVWEMFDAQTAYETAMTD